MAPVRGFGSSIHGDNGLKVLGWRDLDEQGLHDLLEVSILLNSLK